MAKSPRNAFLVFVPLLIAVVWLASSSGVFSRAADSEQPSTAAPAKGQPNHLQEAANSIVAAAKDRVGAAHSDDDAIQRAHLAVESLRLIGRLGEFDTSPQVGELIDNFRTGAHPVAVDAVIQLRLMSEIREWEQLSAAERSAAFEHFVADIKKTGLTRGQADMMDRVSYMLGDTSDRKLIYQAISELLPLARNSKDMRLNEKAGVYEGALRRMDLIGKPLELEGTLLTGAKLDWSAYHGKVVLVDFFASFCTECRAEAPNVVENYRAYHDKGFEVIGVNLDKNRRLAQQYIDQTGFNFPTIFGSDPSASGWDLPLARKYGVTRIPRAILIDQSGNVVSTQALGERLPDLLQNLLGAADRPPTRATSSNEDPSVITAGASPIDTGRVVPASAQEEVAPAPPEPQAAPAPPKE